MENKEKISLLAKIQKTSLDDIIQNVGIMPDNPALAFFRSVYANVSGIPNKNKVALAASVKQDVPQLIGCQANWEHLRKHNIAGSILWADINSDNNIEIVFSLYKTVYDEEYLALSKAVDEGKANVSFELQVDKKNIVANSDGTRTISRCQFDGVGILLENAPAFDGAKIYEEAELNQLMEQDLIFASTIKLNKEKIEMDKTANDALLAAQKKIVSEEFGELVKDWTDEDYLNDEKINALRAEVEAKKKAEEVAVEVPVVDEPVVEIPKEEAKVLTEERIVKTDVVVDDDTGNIEQIVEQTVVVDKTDEVVTRVEETVTVVTYTQAQVDELKALLEKEKTDALLAKDTEIAELQKQKVEAENKLKVISLRQELGKYIESLSDEQLLADESLVKAARDQKEAEAKTLEAASSQSESMTAQTKSETEAATEETEEELDKTECMKAYIQAMFTNKK